MLRSLVWAIAAIFLAGSARWCVAEEILFEDSFDGALSPQWKAIGLEPDDYRVRNGSLEMRVQPGHKKGAAPMLMVLLPFTTDDTVTASVELSLIDRFTEPAESAGL